MDAKADPVAGQSEEIREMLRLFSLQKKAFRAHPLPAAKERMELLKRLNRAILKHQDALVDAVHADFGNRSRAETKIAEIISVLEAIQYHGRKVRGWMRPERRAVPLHQRPAQARVVYQPLGVVGIMVPWNYPIYLALSPLLSAWSAGNRVLIKMSEFTPATARALQTMLRDGFPEEWVSVVAGDKEVGVAFSKLPLDHLLFTGSTSVGRQVMRAASENLTPVTLELGGKSPVLIHEAFPVTTAAERIAFGKCINAGQTCIAPDYVWCARHKVDAFVRALTAVVSSWYPTLRDNQDYTAIVNQRQWDRLQGYLKDAADKGAKILSINPAREDLTGTRKLPVTVLLGTTADMLVEQDEIFGPLLPVKAYEVLEEALHDIQERPRPLAFYYFDYDGRRADSVLARIQTGGACINDTMSHVLMDDLPFGGIGSSGMGQYHGREGFLTFSHAKPVLRKGRLNAAKLIFPPWNRPLHQFLFRRLLK